MFKFFNSYPTTVKILCIWIYMIVGSIALAGDATFASKKSSRSLPIKPVVSDGSQGRTRGECLIIPIIPITEVSITHLSNPLIWVYVVPPKTTSNNEQAKVDVFYSDSNQTIDSEPQYINTNEPQFLRFQIPITKKKELQNQLEVDKEYNFNIRCNGDGNSVIVTIHKKNTNISFANLPLDKRVVEFSKQTWWAETVDALFDKEFLCKDKPNTVELFDDLVRNKLLIEDVFNKPIRAVIANPIEDVDIVNIDRMVRKFNESYFKKTCTPK